MLKKVMLGIVATILLIGAENLIAQERRERPEAAQKERQMWGLRGAERQKGQAERLHRQRAEREAMRRPMKDVRGKPQHPRLRQDRPIQEGFDRWLNELTKAYQENDREKMGQLIRRIRQFRQNLREAPFAFPERGRAFHDRPGPAMPPKGVPPKGKPPKAMEKPGHGGRRERHEGMGRWGGGFLHRDIERRGRRLRRGDMDRWKEDLPFKRFEEWGRAGKREKEPVRIPEDYPPRRFKKRGRGFPGRGMGGYGGYGMGGYGSGMYGGGGFGQDWGRPIERPGRGEPPEGIERPGRGWRREGMGRWRRGSPESRPEHPEPETE